MINTEINVDFSLTTNKQKPKSKITELAIKAFMLSFIVLSISRYTFNILELEKISITGSRHYSENEILHASGLDLDQDKMLGISLPELTEKIKTTLSYIKDVQVSKHNFGRSVDISVTERLPYAAVEIWKQSEKEFLLVDIDGYVLKCSTNPEKLPDISTTDRTNLLVFRLILAKMNSSSSLREGEQLPEYERDGFLVCKRVLDEIRKQIPELVSQIGIITLELRAGSNPMMHLDEHSWSITVSCEDLPQIWLSVDLIQNGLQKVATLIRSNQMHNATNQMLSGYLDARFENVLYWGEEGNGK